MKFSQAFYGFTICFCMGLISVLLVMSVFPDVKMNYLCGAVAGLSNSILYLAGWYLGRREKDLENERKEEKNG